MVPAHPSLQDLESDSSTIKPAATLGIRVEIPTMKLSSLSLILYILRVFSGLNSGESGLRKNQKGAKEYTVGTQA